MRSPKVTATAESGGGRPGALSIETLRHLNSSGAFSVRQGEPHGYVNRRADLDGSPTVATNR